MEFVKAIYGTLIHSLWEGLALALVAAATMVLTKKASSDLRYKLLTGCLLLFTGGILFTFFIQLAKPVNSRGQVFSEITAAIRQNGIAVGTGSGKNQDNVFSVCYDYLNARSSTVVLIWFLVMWVKYLRFAAGLYHVYGLKRRKLLPAGRYWEEKLDELSFALGIKGKVHILQSGLAKIPITLGHLKPMVLIPIGLLNNLSAAEVEAILLHELSHIRRKDYLVNLLQSILEIIFFFNPALLWVSALIKAERENCCDDMVISKTSDKATYIRALLSCQEYNATNHALAMGLSGKKSSLIGRVRRIVSNNNQTLNVMEKGFLTFSMVTAVLVTLTVSSTDAVAVKNAVAVGRKVLVEPLEEHLLKPVRESFAGKTQEKVSMRDRKMPEAADQITEPADTLRKKKNRIISEENGKRYEFEFLNGKVTNLSVDGKKIAEGDLAQYQQEIEGVLRRTKEAGERAEQAAVRAKEASMRAEKAKERAKQSEERIKQGEERVKQGAERAAQAKLRVEASESRRKESEERAAQSEIRAKASAERAKQSEIRAKASEETSLKLRHDLSADLAAAGVIKEGSELNITLSAGELIVNGQKQPAELQKKLSEKYIVRQGMVINIANSANPK